MEKITNLITMVDFVLKQAKSPIHRIDVAFNCIQYANFLDQPTRKNMFYSESKLFDTNISDEQITRALEKHDKVEDILKDWGFKLTETAIKEIYGNA